MTTDANIVLVRSPQELVKDNLIGWGWKQVDFSKYGSIKELFQCFKEKEIKVGRYKNQIKRFFDLEKSDIVVVPVHRAIVIGKVEGTKSYGEGVPYGENRVQVDFYKDSDGRAVKIPRSKLSQGLESRLKIRMTNASLDEFSEEISAYIEQLESNNKVCFDSIFQQKMDAAVDSFKEQLLSNIVDGKTTLKGGGYGLEQLVKELLEIEGYTARIEAKNQSSSISDIDITASRVDPVASNRVYVQVKHHKGRTNSHAVKQLIDIDDDEHHDKWVITTGDVSQSTIDLAKENNIQIMTGKQFVDWVYNRIDKLSPRFREQLGISILPQIIT